MAFSCVAVFGTSVAVGFSTGFVVDSTKLMARACSISPGLNPNGPRPLLYATFPFPSITYNRAGIPLYALPAESLMSSTVNVTPGWMSLRNCSHT